MRRDYFFWISHKILDVNKKKFMKSYKVDPEKKSLKKNRKKIEKLTKIQIFRFLLQMI